MFCGAQVGAATNSVRKQATPCGWIEVTSPTRVIREKPEDCTWCKKEYSIFRCSTFKSIAITERKSVATKANLCFNCLKVKHRVSECLSQARGCGRKHQVFCMSAIPESLRQPNRWTNLKTKLYPRPQQVVKQGGSTIKRHTEPQDGSRRGSRGLAIIMTEREPERRIHIRVAHTQIF